MQCKDKKYKNKWERKFCYLPEYCGDRFVWWEYVERKYVDWWSDPGSGIIIYYKYRFENGDTARDKR